LRKFDKVAFGEARTNREAGGAKRRQPFNHPRRARGGPQGALAISSHRRGEAPKVKTWESPAKDLADSR